MEIRPLDDKLELICDEEARWLQRRSATRKQILSLVGLLQHATKIMKQGKKDVHGCCQAKAIILLHKIE